MAYARQKGIAIPERLSVCGYDDIGESALAEPPLTTVHHPSLEIAKEAARLLIHLIHKETPSDEVIVPARLVVRASAAPPAR